MSMGLSGKPDNAWVRGEFIALVDEVPLIGSALLDSGDAPLASHRM